MIIWKVVVSLIFDRGLDLYGIWIGLVIWWIFVNWDGDCLNWTIRSFLELELKLVFSHKTKWNLFN
jgi:hypothetical protein